MSHASELLHMDDRLMSEAESWIKKSIEADQQNRTTWDLAQGYDLYANWYQRKGDLSHAKENPQRAIDAFREGGADGWVK